ncbi:hypothetical protein ACN24M_38075 [Streptomyces microflavus]|uniref:hypothetical protein n=1 Tax=Streptomyces microflavus TaxID=1919 RepID=UPI003B2174C4
MTRSAAMTLAVLAALVAVVRAVGGQGEPWQAEGWTTVFDGPAEWFMQFIEGASRLVKGGSDGASFSARLGCLLLLILLFVALRRWMLMYYAHKPGAVDVKKLVSSAPGMEQQVEGLSAQLRKQLSETNLYPPTALPAEAPADNFLDLLGDVDLEPRSWAPACSASSAACDRRSPTRFAESSGSGSRSPVSASPSPPTRSGAAAPNRSGVGHGRTRYRRRDTGLLPVTRAGRRPPWQEWCGRDLPPELFAAYQQARELSGQRKFDDALESYYEALRFDPTNLYLRTQIAGIQEQLWLHLDALETYYGALRLDGRKSAQRNARTGMRSWDPRRTLRHRYGWWRGGVLEARIRYAVVLGVAERTADQWCKGDDPPCPRRTHARKQIRQALAPALAARHWHAFAGLKPPGRAESFGPDQEGPVSMIRLRHPFVRAHGTLTRTSLRLNRDVWAPLRLAWAHEDAGSDRMELLENPLPWPSSADRLARRIRSARGGLRGVHRWLSPGWSPGRGCSSRTRTWRNCVRRAASSVSNGRPTRTPRRTVIGPNAL